MKEEPMNKEFYMRRCIQIARNGCQDAAPNPMVGAVIVCDGKIIGEGYHARCGEAHAEVNAIRSVRQPELLSRSTLFVSLEPCAHYGKTPPCADLIVQKRIPRVVIGCQDPFAKVDGLGIKKLRDAGCEVTVGILEQECRQLIRRFITFHTQQRPYVTLKWAESSDGFIDAEREGGSPVKLSSDLSMMLVHKRRAEHSAILVGTRTALKDNPTLTVRQWYGRNPVRVVIDRHNALPDDLHLFDDQAPTVVWRDGSLPQLLHNLYERGLQSLLVEGGSRLLQSFIDEGLWDEAFVELSPAVLQRGVPAPTMPGIAYRIERQMGRYYRHYPPRFV